MNEHCRIEENIHCDWVIKKKIQLYTKIIYYQDFIQYYLTQ